MGGTVSDGERLEGWLPFRAAEKHLANLDADTFAGRTAYFFAKVSESGMPETGTSRSMSGERETTGSSQR